MRAWMLIVAVAGCGTKAERFEGTLPIAFGDCASATVAFVSGPRPQAFTAAQAEQATVAATDAPEPTVDAPSTPPAAPARTDFAQLTGTSDLGSADDKHVSAGILGVGGGAGTGGFGYGRSGFGPGGGTGWGTIGTGGYGTIGHGGVGRHGRLGGVPTVSVAVGQPNAQGDFNPALIRRYVKRNINKIQYCYERQLLSNPKLAGTVAVQFYITPDGTVGNASASGVDPQVSSCVVGVIKNIEFPKPGNGAGVQVNYPFTFRQAGDTSSAGTGSAAAPPAPAPAPPPPPAAPADHARRLYRLGGTAQAYEPGADNPLRLERDALTECLRGGSVHAGAIVVELHYDASGAIASAITHGLDDTSVQDCIAAAAKRAVQPKGAPSVQRCGLAFGTRPATQILALSATGATFAGKPIVLGPAGAADFPALTANFATDVKAAVAATSVLTTRDPIVLRPDPATPMVLVERAWRSVISAGDDVVFADLQPLTLPAPPVPFSTGARRTRVKPTGHGGDGDERVVLSVYVTKARIWVGVSRVNEFFEVAPPDLGKLEARLKDEKASAFFADRTDVEIAGDDDVPFDAVVKALDVAAKVGFSDWTITDPRHLAAYPTL